LNSLERVTIVSGEAEEKIQEQIAEGGYQHAHTFVFYGLIPEMEKIVLEVLHQCENDALFSLSPPTVLPFVIDEIKEEDYDDALIAELEAEDRGQARGLRIVPKYIAQMKEHAQDESLGVNVNCNTPGHTAGLLHEILDDLNNWMNQFQCTKSGIFGKCPSLPSYWYEGLFKDGKLQKKHWISALALTFKSSKRLAIESPDSSTNINWTILGEDMFLNTIIGRCDDHGSFSPTGAYGGTLTYIDQDRNIWDVHERRDSEGHVYGNVELEGVRIDGVDNDEVWAYAE
jgi:hypothetical protein